MYSLLCLWGKVGRLLSAAKCQAIVVRARAVSLSKAPLPAARRSTRQGTRLTASGRALSGLTAAFRSRHFRCVCARRRVSTSLRPLIGPPRRAATPHSPSSCHLRPSLRRCDHATIDPPITRADPLLALEPPSSCSSACRCSPPSFIEPGTVAQQPPDGDNDPPCSVRNRVAYDAMCSRTCYWRTLTPDSTC